MFKKYNSSYLLMILVALFPSIGNAQSHQSISFSYCINPLDNLNLGTGLATTYHACILLPEARTKSYGGNFLTSVSIGTGDVPNSGCMLWLSHDLNDYPFYTQPINLMGNQLIELINLDEPYEIEDGMPLYVGWSCTVDEYSLPFKGESDRSGSKADSRGDIVGWEDENGVINWKHLGDFGYGNLLLFLNIEGATLPTYDIAIEDIKYEQYVSAGSPVEISGKVRNYGTQPIDSYTLSYRVGSKPPTNIQPQCWEMQTCAVNSFSFTIDRLIVGSNLLTVTLSNPNGQGDENTDDNTWQGSIICYNITNPDRNVLLEQFSTTLCAFCPAGHDRIKEAVSDFNNVIWVTHHAGYYEDIFTTDDDRELLWFYGSGQTFAPAMMLDRTNLSNILISSTPGPVCNVENVNQISRALVYAMNQPSLVKINTDCYYDKQTRKLEVKVSGFSLVDLSSQDICANVYIVEDGIVYPQLMGSYYDTEYVHDNVFRESVTPLWGEPVTWDNRKFDNSYTYELPIDFNENNVRIVAFVSSYNSGNVNDCIVFDSNMISLMNESSVELIDRESENWKAWGNKGEIVFAGNYDSVRVYGIDGSYKGRPDYSGRLVLPKGCYVVTDNITPIKILVE